MKYALIVIASLSFLQPGCVVSPHDHHDHAERRYGNRWDRAEDRHDRLHYEDSLDRHDDRWDRREDRYDRRRGW